MASAMSSRRELGVVADAGAAVDLEDGQLVVVERATWVTIGTAAPR